MMDLSNCFTYAYSDGSFSDFHKVNHAIDASKHVKAATSIRSHWRLNVLKCSDCTWMQQTLMKRLPEGKWASAAFRSISPDKRTYVGVTWVQENSQSSSADISETKEKVKPLKRTFIDMGTKMHETYAALSKFSASVRRAEQTLAQRSTQKMDGS